MSTKHTFIAVLTALLCAGAVALPSTAAAQESCAPQDEGEVLESHRLLRQLALDLLGRIPTMEEWEMLDSGAGIDETLLPAMLASDEYFAQVREQHRALLWGSLGNTDNIGSGSFLISRISRRDTWRAGNLRRRYRGTFTIECLDQPQPADQYDANGRPIPITVVNGEAARAMGCDPADGPNGSQPHQCRQEGTVMVAPYWDPANPIKVCAYDAQALALDSGGNACDLNNTNAWCGCGPNLRECIPSMAYEPQKLIRRALEEEPARIFENVIRDERSYMEAFTTNETYVNGRSAHYYRHQSGHSNPRAGGPITYNPLMPDLPEMPFTDESWVRVERAEGHAGVLTTMSFLMRFASNRGRANRFFTAFRCEPFVPPSEGLPEDTSEHPNPNLRERVGCDSCHNRLEPLASHWGRWRQNGTHGFLDEAVLPTAEPVSSCVECGGTAEDGTAQRNCAAFCNAYFVTGANSDPAMVAEWEGYPLARAWLTHDETTNIEAGPRGLIDDADEIARVASCTVRTVAQRLFGRDLTQEESVVWVPTMADSFAASDYNYTALVRDIVATDTYRSVR